MKNWLGLSALLAFPIAAILFKIVSFIFASEKNIVILLTFLFITIATIPYTIIAGTIALIKKKPGKWMSITGMSIVVLLILLSVTLKAFPTIS